jgi:uncharacterized RDD family membrane protein YckC
MTAPKVTVKGVYALTISQDLLEEAMVTKYGGVKLNPEQMQAARNAIREELSHVILVDLLVKNAPEEYNLADIPQGAEQEKPYSLMYLTLDGTAAISRKRPKNEKDIRISFYLHDVRPGDKLKIVDDEVELPAAKPMDFVTYNNNPYRPRVKVNAAIAAAVGESYDRNTVWEGSGFWIRAAAYIIDGLLISFATSIIAFPLMFGTIFNQNLSQYTMIYNANRYMFLLLLLGNIPTMAYFVICESVYGATPGKLICGLRVIKADRTLCNVWQVFLRYIFRMIDGLICGLPAALFMSSHRNQRIGDYIANSYVVNTGDYEIKNKRPVIYQVLSLLACLLIIVVSNIGLVYLYTK